MDQRKLEAEAKQARRRADIAKHTPISLDTLDAYGEEEMRLSGRAQINLLNLACELQNAYAREISALWSVVRMLRADAMYWRLRCEEIEAEVARKDGR